VREKLISVISLLSVKVSTYKISPFQKKNILFQNELQAFPHYSDGKKVLKLPFSN
jgi:hypothetical protein